MITNYVLELLNLTLTYNTVTWVLSFITSLRLIIFSWATTVHNNVCSVRSDSCASSIACFVHITTSVITNFDTTESWHRVWRETGQAQPHPSPACHQSEKWCFWNQNPVKRESARNWSPIFTCSSCNFKQCSWRHRYPWTHLIFSSQGVGWGGAGWGRK